MAVPTPLPETEDALQRHVEKHPGDAAAWSRLAELALRRQDLDAALWALAAASRLAPASAGILNNVALVQLLAGRPEEGEKAAARAVALDPGHALAWRNLAQARGDLGRVEEAEKAYREAIRLDPASGESHFGLAAALAHQGRWTEAFDAYEATARLVPGSADPWIGMANAALRVGRRRDAVEILLQARDADAERAAEVESHALFAMQYGDEFTPEQVFEAHAAWAKRHVPPPQASVLRWPTKERVRIGFVSPSFRRTAMSFALLPVLENLDRDRFVVACYSQSDAEDEVTARMKRHVDGWMDTRVRDDAMLAASIRDDRIDVLVDLAGHTPGNRLPVFGKRLAAAQLSWLDYFNTTGIPTMDALLVDDVCGSHPRQRFVEKLVSLGPVRYPYQAPADAPDLPPPRDGAPGIVFGSFARMAKVCATTVDAWCAAMAAVPGSRLLLKNDAASDPHVRENLGSEFGKRGVDPARVEWRTPSPHARMLAEYGDVDIVLDTLPYNGGVTTLEALWMGRPVVTMRGSTLVGRQGESILAAIGRPQWVAADREGFAATAKALAADRPALAREQASLRDAMKASALCDHAGFTRRFEATLLELLER